MGERLDYYDPNKSGSFSGARRFPKQWLQSQDTYTLHKPVRKKFKRKKTIVPGARFQMQADLVDFSLLKSYNDNYKYSLVVVDVFSIKAFTAYLKSKSSSDMIEAFKRVMSEIGKKKTERLWRYFTYTNSRRYVEVLPALVESYNNTHHRFIGRATNSVNTKNQESVWLTLYAHPELQKPKLKVGDQVRLSISRMRFHKGYLQFLQEF